MDAVVVGPGVGSPALGLRGVAIRILSRQVWEDVVEVLRGLAHHRGALVDQALGDEAGVEVDVLAHRVVTHVLDAAGDREVACAHRDLSGGRGDGGQRAGAHPVDGEAGNRVREAGEEPDIAAEREALVAHLRGGRHDDIADPLRRDLRRPPEELPHDLDGHVVCAGLPEETARARLAERRSHPVDEHDLPERASHHVENTAGVD